MTKPLTEAECDLTKKSSISIGRLLTHFATFAAAATIVMCLFGYGVALAVESVFGLPHSSLFSSAFELLDLSSIAIVSFMEGGMDFVQTGQSSILRLYSASWKILTIGILTWLAILAIVLILRKKWPALFVQSTQNKHARRPLSFTKKTLLANLTVISAIALQPILAFLAASALVFATVLIAVAPVMGFSGAESYIQRWVLDPEYCKPLLVNRKPGSNPNVKSDKKSKKSVALCLKVSDKDKEIASGRLVFATSSAAVLFDPRTASAKRVPLNGLVIESISEIPATKPSAASSDVKTFYRLEQISNIDSHL
jgi:hypothetical protein